ncbi:MAG: cysteine desulfurase [Gammaproteobacteria bacterium]|nr:cysteine desulfurase [Gammaproteobacteria bacterium]MYH33968.1 cysteine desulfurase [Gammaproteobacteria bacterium]MYL00598.1 cysteine desulfurase [Gammaproteobacteria bacterium]
MSSATARLAAVQEPLSVQTLRADFPGLATTVHGYPLAYLDNAASTQRPRAVMDALTTYEVEMHANVHRGVHARSDRATAAFEGARERTRGWLNAASANEIVFTRGATESINLVARCMDGRMDADSEIVLTGMEHHSNIVPWQQLCERTGAEIRVAPVLESGALDMAALAELIGSRTRLVAVTHVSNAMGVINPVAEICELARRANAPILIDGAQAAGHIPLDVQELGCDFYALSGHKMYAPTGIGALYARRPWLDELPPFLGGGEMILEVRFDGTTYNEPPHKFEAGTPNISGAVGLGAAMDYLAGRGLERLAALEHDLLEHATERLQDVPGLKIIGTASPKSAVVSFVIDGIHPHDLGTVLDHEGVAIRAGHHCAMPLMDRFGVPGTSRASFAFYNTHEEIDRLVAGIGTARKLLGQA